MAATVMQSLNSRAIVTRSIPLASGQLAFVDQADYALVSQYRWYHIGAGPGSDIFYAIRIWNDVTGRHVQRMHNLIMGFIGVDHINHNGFDNRRANLRDGRDGVNEHHARKRKDGLTSEYKGVSWGCGHWRANINFKGQRYYLGYFDIEEDAAQAYNQAARWYFGDSAVLNIIEESS